MHHERARCQRGRDLAPEFAATDAGEGICLAASAEFHTSMNTSS